MSIHITEKTLSRQPGWGFYIILGMMWIWPLILVLCLLQWEYPSVGLRLLYKSTWVLYAGVTQSWCLLLGTLKRYDLKKWMNLLGIFAVLSFFLLPVGLGRWEFYNQYKNGVMNSTYQLARDWSYGANLLLSLLLHGLAIMPISLIYVLANPSEPPIYSGGMETGEYDSSLDSDLDAAIGLGAGAWMAKSWGNSQLFKPLSDSYYGHHGEFDRNDESRRISEDMQQFHSNHPNADLSDHYFWDDVRDAETDGYLDKE